MDCSGFNHRTRLLTYSQPFLEGEREFLTEWGMIAAMILFLLKQPGGKNRSVFGIRYEHNSMNGRLLAYCLGCNMSEVVSAAPAG